jgi:hypothetical protein
MKNSRKAKQYYTLLNRDGREVSIDLNNYKVTCTKTGARKSFYHKYLHGLIQSKYAGNIDTFRETYVSRQAGPSKKDRQVAQLQAQIERARARLNQLNDRLSLINS